MFFPSLGNNSGKRFDIMKSKIKCDYIPIVSKSLLIVIGTLSTPAVIFQGKRRPREFQCTPAGLGSAFGLPSLSFKLLKLGWICPRWRLMASTPKRRGRAGQSLRTPAFRLIGVMDELSNCKKYISACLRIVPLGGLPLSRLMTSSALPAVGNRHLPHRD